MDGKNRKAGVWQTMRRSDREIVDRAELERILGACPVIRLGVVVDGMAYIVPMNFGVDFTGGAVSFYFHSFNGGTKVKALREQGQASFELDNPLGLVGEGDVACVYSMDYESVMGSGPVTFLEDPADKSFGLSLMMAHYSDMDGFVFDDQALGRVAVFRLDADNLTGKARRG
jgi:nitroimidazol reductase NimA-like FMN-containing flavoprotein (pyridoxamine 5'-phosphate oxidase superfamily)